MAFAAVRGLIAGKVPMASPRCRDRRQADGSRWCAAHISMARRRRSTTSRSVRSAASSLTILGESGSGKTTMLRIISGLERPTRIERLAIRRRGRLRPAGGDAQLHHGLPRTTRCFPHMSVGENVGYGLKVRGVSREASRRQALDALAMVRMGDKETRRIHQLSGGERQRVALARALVTRPAIPAARRAAGRARRESCASRCRASWWSCTARSA